MERPPFFPGASPALRELLDKALREIAAGVEDVAGFRTLVLAGGYGRGEGGVAVDTATGAETLYNDLEFYLFAGPPTPATGRWIACACARGHDLTGIEVEVKAMTPAQLASARPSMFYYDLLAANHIVAGDGAWLATLPAALSDGAAIPPDEGSRLLVNRGCSLLLCARAAAGETTVPPGFIVRILAKLKLALGDAILCLHGAYHWSCLERGRRLTSLSGDFPHAAHVRAWHAEAEEFKLHPVVSTAEPSTFRNEIAALRQAWCDIFLHVESARLGGRFASVRDYAFSASPLLPHESALKNAIRHGRERLRGGRVHGPWTRHPREAVWRSLALLIASEDGAERVLGCPPGKAGEACRALWQRYP